MVLASSPWLAFLIGALSFWLVLFMPFAFWARSITRPDSLNGLEAFLIGATCGPVGVWLVMRANQRAADRQYRAGLLIDQLKVHPDAINAVPDVVKSADLPPTDLPGSAAYQPPPKHVVKSAPVSMDTVRLEKEPAAAPAEAPERAPLEPQQPPPTKAAGAFQPPPPVSPFTGSGEDAGAP